MLSYRIKLRHILILRLVYIKETLNYLIEKYTMIQNFTDQMWKIEKSQDHQLNYVKRHHSTTKIIGDKDARPMTRNRLRSATCLLSMREPKIVKDALEDDNWYKAMEEEIQQIEKNNTWSLVPIPEDKI